MKFVAVFPALVLAAQNLNLAGVCPLPVTIDQILFVQKTPVYVSASYCQKTTLTIGSSTIPINNVPTFLESTFEITNTFTATSTRSGLPLESSICGSAGGERIHQSEPEILLPGEDGYPATKVVLKPPTAQLPAITASLETTTWPYDGSKTSTLTIAPSGSGGNPKVVILQPNTANQPPAPDQPNTAPIGQSLSTDTSFETSPVASQPGTGSSPGGFTSTGQPSAGVSSIASVPPEQASTSVSATGPSQSGQQSTDVSSSDPSASGQSSTGASSTGPSQSGQSSTGASSTGSSQSEPSSTGASSTGSTGSSGSSTGTGASSSGVSQPSQSTGASSTGPSQSEPSSTSTSSNTSTGSTSSSGSSTGTGASSSGVSQPSQSTGASSTSHSQSEQLSTSRPPTASTTTEQATSQSSSSTALTSSSSATECIITATPVPECCMNELPEGCKPLWTTDGEALQPVISSCKDAIGKYLTEDMAECWEGEVTKDSHGEYIADCLLYELEDCCITELPKACKDLRGARGSAITAGAAQCRDALGLFVHGIAAPCLAEANVSQATRGESIVDCLEVAYGFRSGPVTISDGAVCPRTGSPV